MNHTTTSPSQLLETIRIKDGAIKHLQYHQTRANEAALEIWQQPAPNLNQLLENEQIPQEGVWRCRIIFDQEQQSVTFTPHQARPVSSLKIVYDNEIDYHLKWLQREAIDQLFVQRETCDDILIVKNNYITDTSIANLIFWDNQKWLTPHQPLLNGTCRQRLINTGFLHEAEIKINNLSLFKKIGFINALIDENNIPVIDISESEIRF